MSFRGNGFCVGRTGIHRGYWGLFGSNVPEGRNNAPQKRFKTMMVGPEHERKHEMPELHEWPVNAPGFHRHRRASLRKFSVKKGFDHHIICRLNVIASYLI